ncbi:MAG: hypothetical protein V5A52_02940 [Halovenus sp.]
MDTRIVAVIGVVVLLLSAGGVTATTNLVDIDGDETPIVGELRAGTDPLDGDTDGDGLGDGLELREYETDPTTADTDGDGIDDGAEINDYGTDPTESDTDSDRLPDGAEINDYGTDPTAADTDGDGLDDNIELNEYGTDPLNADTDSDGLDDSREITEYGTDPVVADTDEDGLSDEFEVDGETDPTVADTDGDGLDDGPEINEYGTDPAVKDTDGDGFTDGEEVHLEDTLPGADPTRVDIYVEVDYMESPGLTDAEQSALEDSFADAPVENPDGSEGISLHIDMDEEVPTERPLALSASSDDQPDLDEYAVEREYFDHRNQGYQYALVVEEATMDGREVGGAAWIGESGFIVRQYSWDDFTGSTFMHELGHSLELRHHPDGPSEVTFDRYPSTMNYNKPNDYYGFSSGDASGDDIDEWNSILDSIPDSIPDTSELPRVEPES